MPEDEVTNTNPFDPANDFFGELKDYKPEEVKDEGGFVPFKGSYVCRVTRLTHNVGISTKDNNPYDFYSLNLQVIEVIDGDKALNRYLTKRYQNTNEGIKKLMNDLFTSGVEFEKGSREDFDLSLTNAIDKQMQVRTWIWTPDKDMSGNPIPEDERIAKQQFKIVKDFSGKKVKSSEIPF